MIFVVQKLLMPATLHLKIQGCKGVRTVPDLGAAFSAVRTSSLFFPYQTRKESRLRDSVQPGWVRYRMQELEDRQLGHVGKRRLTFWQEVCRRGGITSLGK